MTGREAILIVGMMAVTFGVRYPVLALVSRLTLPDQLLLALRFIPPAVLTAIIVPALVLPAGRLDFSRSNAYLWAGLLATLIAWRRQNLLLTIVVGMLGFLLWRWVV